MSKYIKIKATINKKELEKFLKTIKHKRFKSVKELNHEIESETNLGLSFYCDSLDNESEKAEGYDFRLYEHITIIGEQYGTVEINYLFDNQNMIYVTNAYLHN